MVSIPVYRLFTGQSNSVYRIFQRSNCHKMEPINFSPLFIIRVLLLVVLAHQHTYAQETDTDTPAKGYDLHLEAGIKYVPYLGGFSTGLSLYSPHKSFAFTLRNDVLLAIGRPDDPIGIPPTLPNQLQPFILTDFNTQTYFEAEYRVLKKKNKVLAVHAGYGWIYNGIHRNYIFDATRGYSVLTTAISYKPSWFTLELRGDVPLNSAFHSKMSGTTERVFPVAIGIKYRFKPRKQE